MVRGRKSHSKRRDGVEAETKRKKTGVAVGVGRRESWGTLRKKASRRDVGVGCGTGCEWINTWGRKIETGKKGKLKEQKTAQINTN